LAVVDGDGGGAPVTPEQLTAWKSEIERIAKSGRYQVQARRWAAERVRFAIWDGQSDDGRKHADAQDGKAAFPFEGASDARIRLADMIVNERVLILTAAALRNMPRVKALDVANEPLGAKLTTLLKWVLINKLGSQYLREVVKIAQYQEADSPAGAVLGAWWEEEWALEMRTLSREELGQILTAPQEEGGYGLDAQAVNELDVQLQNPAKDAETAKLLEDLLPTLSDKRRKKMVAELREKNTAEFPVPYQKVNQPCLTAYRLYEDIFFPPGTTDVRRRARFHVIREWVDEVSLRERKISAGYTDTFIEEVLKHPAQSAFPECERSEIGGEWTPISAQEMQELHHGEYELLTVLYRAVNEDSVPGIYAVTLHHQVTEAATERAVLGYAHGEYPLTWFGREILGTRLLDSRGVPELVATQQSALKQLHDSFHDNASLSTLPNILVPRRRSKLALVIKPLGIIKEDRPGDVRYMQPPQYPGGNDKQQEAIKQFVDEYFGRISEKVPALLTQLHQSGMVMNFLLNLSDALKQMLQLCQQYLSDDELAQITGDDGIAIAHSREEIQGQFMVQLDFDPANLNMDYFKEVADLVLNLVLKADTMNVVQRDKLIQWLLSSISPSLAANTIRPVEAAQQSEIADEENNFTKIASGIEPPMVAEGMDFATRLQVLTGIPQLNPDAVQNLSPKSREIYEARVKYLQNQVQQMKNAQIGRQVGQPALGQEATMPGMSGAGRS
jgi:hypothetical protein